jgi:hypothetical protein
MKLNTHDLQILQAQFKMLTDEVEAARDAKDQSSREIICLRQIQRLCRDFVEVRNERPLYDERKIAR